MPWKRTIGRPYNVLPTPSSSFLSRDFSANAGHGPDSAGATGSLLASGRFLYVLKLADLDGSFRELGGDFEFSAHGFDEILERAHVHVRAALELGYGGLVDAENPGKMHLRHLARLPEFVQSHPRTILGRQQTGTLLGCGRHLCAERIEVLGQRGSPVIGHSIVCCLPTSFPLELP